MKARAEGSNKAKQKQDRRVDGEEDNGANPHLIECFYKEQGDIRTLAQPLQP